MSGRVQHVLRRNARDWFDLGPPSTANQQQVFPELSLRALHDGIHNFTLRSLRDMKLLGGSVRETRSYSFRGTTKLIQDDDNNGEPRSSALQFGHTLTIDGDALLIFRVFQQVPAQLTTVVALSHPSLQRHDVRMDAPDPVDVALD